MQTRDGFSDKTVQIRWLGLGWSLEGELLRKYQPHKIDIDKCKACKQQGFDLPWQSHEIGQ